MHYPARALLCVVLGLAVFPPAIFAAPKVEEALVGPANQPGHYVISARGAHLGFAGKKGDRFVVNVDGVEGPAIDQLFRPTGENVLETNRVVIGPASQTTTGQYNEGPLLMSVDGEHHAYLARQGTDVVVIHDGKVIGRAPLDRYYFQSNPLRISPDGSQVAWTEVDASQPQPLYRVVVNGKPGPWAAAAGSSNVVFSADGSRHAYLVTLKDRKAALVVDGKEAGYSGSNPTFTGDGKLLITSGLDGKQAAILVDGKPVATGVRAGRIFAAPTGRRWGALLFRKDAQFNDVSVLIIDGKEVSDGAETQNVWFSPDGKRYAAASHHHFNRGPDYMIVDGKRGAEYVNVIDGGDPFWSPDSSTFIYAAKSATGPHIVVVANGKEAVFSGRLIDNSVAFSDRGGRYAFSKTDPRNQNQVGHVVDGQEIAQGPALKSGSFSFSADGSRYGYLTNQQGPTATLVLNGEAVPGFSSGFLGSWSAGGKGPWFSLTADGRSVAAYARDAANSTVGLWLDGKLVHPTKGSIAYPRFTLDGKHLVWGAEGPTGLVVYVDGVPAVRAEAQFFGLRPDIWDMDKNGVVTFLGADGDRVKRYRITAAPDTTVATLLANGTQMPVAPAPAVVTAPPAATLPSAPVPAAPKPSVAPATPAVAAGALTWNDLVRRPEARPNTCTVNKEYRFQGGATVRAGSKVNIVELKPAELVLETQDGRITFGARPEETDILAVANAAWAQLTPAQRDLTTPSLLQRPELWPYRLKLTAPFTLQGRTTKIGDAALLLAREGNDLLIRLEGTDIAFTVAPDQTDLMAQARIMVANDTTAPGRLLEELAGKLVSPTTGQPVALEAGARPKYVVMYMGAGWCGPCQIFSPKLVALLKEKAPKPGEVALLYISGDRSAAEAKAYVTKIGINWPTLYFKNRGQMPAFHSLFGDGIPQLVVTDRHGKVVIDSAKVGQDRALQQLKQLL